MSRSYRIVAGVSLSLLLCLAGLFAGMMHSGTGQVVARSEDSRGGTVELQSPIYPLDQVYMSMQGPRSNQPMIQLSSTAEPEETLWLTGVETNVIDATSLEPISNEFFCHSNLTLNPETTNPDHHNVSFETPTHADWRFFTLVPGRMTIQLPKGFGLPVKNLSLLDYYTMALNQNAGLPDRNVRMHTRLSYRRSTSELEKVQPLFRRALYVYQQHKVAEDDGSAAEAPIHEHDGADQTLHALFDEYDAAPLPLDTALGGNHSLGAHQGELCAETSSVDQRSCTPSRFGGALDSHPGATCCVFNASVDGIMPQFGDENTAHWMVPPGHHQYRTEVTEQMQLPFDTTAHYVTGHLHPFGTSLRLIDLETDEVVFEIAARSLSDRLGVEWMSELKSYEGVPIHRGRRYELIAEYNNTLDQPIDAMGILYVYALDQAPQH